MWLGRRSNGLRTCHIRGDLVVNWQIVANHRESNGAFVVDWQIVADEDEIKKHRYHKLPYTDVWCLIYRDGCSFQDVTLLLPASWILSMQRRDYHAGSAAVSRQRCMLIALICLPQFFVHASVSC